MSGVVLANGEEIAAPLVISTADPTQTLGGMVDPVWLDPDVLLAVRNIKYRGCTAFVLYALESLPGASARGLGADELASVVSLTTNLSALERAYDAAKYGGVSAEPHVEISVPTLRWPSLAPDGKHVLAARVQYVPYEPADGGWNGDRVRALSDSVTKVIDRALPGFDAPGPPSRQRSHPPISRRGSASRAARSRTASSRSIRFSSCARSPATADTPCRSTDCILAGAARIRAPAFSAAPDGWRRGPQ